jgi:RimJ/RimL family protein N-acetyltransferase
MVYKTVVLNNGQEAMLDWLKKEDISEVVEVLNEVIKEGRYLFMNNPITDMNKELEWYEGATRDGMLYLTARVEGKFIAGASIHPETDKHSHIASYGIFIDKNHRNLGLGTLLTREFIEIAKRQGLEILQLSVYSSNERAFHVYAKCGFRKAGLLTKGIKFLDGTYADEILMELLLKQRNSQGES